MSEPIKNAEKIIERFGGIRPMASKIGVPVTTVQGWKKRDAIPENRIDEIIAVANQNGIDLTDLVVRAVQQQEAEDAPEQLALEVVEGEKEDQTEEPDPVSEAADFEDQGEESGDEEDSFAGSSGAEKAEEPSKPVSVSSDEGKTGGAVTPLDPFARDQGRSKQTHKPPRPAGQVPSSRRVPESEKHAIQTSSLISIILILLVAMASASYLWPMLREHSERISVVEKDVENLQGTVESVQREQEDVKSLIPTDWKQELASLQQQTKEAADMVKHSIKDVEKIPGEVMRGDVMAIPKRLKKFDQYVNDMTAQSPFAQGFVDTIDSLLDEDKGRKNINLATQSLVSAFNSLGEETSKDATDVMEEVRNTDPAAAEIFKHVPKEDLKGAGLMLSLTQLRQALSEDDQPFASQLALLNSLLGDQDPALRHSMENIQDQAKEGVSTVPSLGRELDGLEEEVVQASLQEDDVTLGDQAAAQFNNLIKVEKDGELLTGTPTQAKLNKAKKLISQGNIKGAKAIIDTLPEKDKLPLKGWLKKAESTIQVQEFENELDQSLGSVTGLDYLHSWWINTRTRQSLKSIE